MSNNCPCCGEPISEVFVYFAGGALRRVGENSAVMDNGLSGFLNAGWHDHHRNRPHVDIVSDSAAGQFEMYFCDTVCLEQWFKREIVLKLGVDSEE